MLDTMLEDFHHLIHSYNHFEDTQAQSSHLPKVLPLKKAGFECRKLFENRTWVNFTSIVPLQVVKKNQEANVKPEDLRGVGTWERPKACLRDTGSAVQCWHHWAQVESMAGS